MRVHAEKRPRRCTAASGRTDWPLPTVGDWTLIWSSLPPAFAPVTNWPVRVALDWRSRRRDCRRFAADFGPPHLRHRRGGLAPKDNPRAGRARLRNGRHRGEPSDRYDPLLLPDALRHEAQAHGGRRGELRRLRGRGRETASLWSTKIRFRAFIRKLVVSHDGARILEGIFVGDTSNFDRLLGLFPAGRPVGGKSGKFAVWQSRRRGRIGWRNAGRREGLFVQ